MIDKVGPWSKDKLRLLEKYLEAYAIIMNRQKDKWLKAFHYIDAFAGTGEVLDRETQEFIDGSVRVALNVEPHFDVYWFIEKSPQRVKILEEIKKEYSNKNIKILQGDCNDELEKVIGEITYESKQRGVVFLDPYGLQVKWDTVKKLGKARTFDIFVNFSLMGIFRNLPVSKEPDSQTIDMMNEIMGNVAWIDKIYYKSKGLFGADLVSRKKIRCDILICIYLDQVKGVFKYASHPVIMRNSKNSPIYALFLASHNKTARRIMNEIERDFHERVDCERVRSWLDTRR